MPVARKNEQSTAATDGAWVSLHEATKLLDVRRELVLQLALKGILEVEHRGRFTFVSRASIDRHLANTTTTVGP